MLLAGPNLLSGLVGRPQLLIVAIPRHSVAVMITRNDGHVYGKSPTLPDERQPSAHTIDHALPSRPRPARKAEPSGGGLLEAPAETINEAIVGESDVCATADSVVSGVNRVQNGNAAYMEQRPFLVFGKQLEDAEQSVERIRRQGQFSRRLGHQETGKAGTVIASNL